MDVKVKSIETNVVELEIQIDKDVFDKEGIERAYQKNKRHFNIPGFRKGKAPRNIVERYYGESIFYEDAVNFVCPDAYQKALEENNIQPVSQPTFDIKQIGKGKDFIFTAKLTVKPDVELGQYKGLEVEKEEVKITEEDIEEEIRKIAEQNSRLIAVEDREAEKGDVVNIDFEGIKDGEPFEGGTAEGFVLEIGSGNFIPGFEEQLIGLKAGDEKEINVTFPEDYHNKELAGQDVVFKIKINEVKSRELPKIDDEFAKDVSEFDTLEEYKADIAKKLEERKRREIEDKFREALVNKVLDNTKIEVPEIMIENQIESFVQDFSRQIAYNGLDFQKYLKFTGISEEKFREDRRKEAERIVRQQLVIEKIIEVEGIEATEEDLEEEIKNLAERYKQEVEDFKEHLNDYDIRYIKNNIKVDKALDLLAETAKVK